MGRTLIQQNLDLITNDSLTETNRELLLRFLNDCIADGLGERRIAKYVGELRKLSKWLGIDFDKATIDDIKRVVVRLETSSLAQWTKSDYKVALRKFYRWLKGGDDYPEIVRWIRPKRQLRRQMLPTSLLNDEDIRRLVVAAEHARDRAFVVMLYESGARIGEILSLQLKHVSFDQFGAVITVNGKTGPRRIRLVFSVPHLTAWLNEHPAPHNPESSVWVTRNHRVNGLCYNRVRQLLRQLKRRAGLSKPVNPHHFRHSRATILANHLTEAQMKHYLGWVQGSAMAAVYVHLSGRDVDNAVLRLNGLAMAEVSTENTLKPKACPACSTVNLPTNQFCSRCSATLVQLDQERNLWDEKMSKLVQDPEVQQLLVRKMKELEARNRIG